MTLELFCYVSSVALTKYLNMLIYVFLLLSLSSLLFCVCYPHFLFKTFYLFESSCVEELILCFKQVNVLAQQIKKLQIPAGMPRVERLDFGILLNL